MKPKTRMVIYAKDIQRITGKTDRSARNIIYALRQSLGKQKHQFISVREFCAFMKISEQEVAPYLED